MFTLTYNGSNQLIKVEEKAKRSITFAYNGEGLVKEATDVLGTVKYTYVSGNLTEVTDLDKHVWKYGYNASNEMTSQTDPLSHAVTTEYNEAHQVISQTDAMGRTRKWKYLLSESGMETTVNNPNGAVTVEHFNNENLPMSITDASGTSLAATTTYEYNPEYELSAVTDPNKHTTKYSYSQGNRTSETDADGDKTEWTYDELHEVLTATTPGGEKTTIERGSYELPFKISREAPGGPTQVTTYKYVENGDLESVTDPLGRTWKYEYDPYGDRKSETDPEGNKRTWAYNEASQETSTVAPRGNVTGSTPAEFTTTIERDAEGRPLAATEPGQSDGKPANKAQATISGQAQEGQTLSAGSGIWEGSPPLSYTYQWQHCNATGGSCSNVSGATQLTYSLTNSDVGYTIRIVVTATDSAGSASSTSEATPVVSASAPRFVSAFGSQGTGGGQFEGVWGGGLDSHGDLWVTDRYNHRIEEFLSSGSFMLAVGWGVKDGKAEAETCTSSCKVGISGSGSGQLEEPLGLAVNQSNGNIYVIDDAAMRIEEFSSAGAFVATIGGKGSGGGQFSKAQGVAIDSSGNVWVADTSNDRIEELSSLGSFMLAVGWGVKDGKAEAETCTSSCEAGIAGSGNGQMYQPTSIAFSGGNVYVDDYSNGRVDEFSTAGAYLSKFGSGGSGSGQINGSYSLAADPTTGNLYVADSSNNRIQLFTPTGTFLAAFGSEGSGSGQFNLPTGVTISSSGNVYVADHRNYRIEQLTPAPASPAYASVFGSKGMAGGQFEGPEDDAVDSHGDVWATDRYNYRLEEFSSSGTFMLAVGWGVKDGKAEAETCTSSCKVGISGSGGGQFEGPMGLVVNQASGNIYVVDYLADRVEEFTSAGAFVTAFGSKGSGGGQFSGAEGLAIDSSGNVWVADTSNDRIEELSSLGSFMLAVGWGVKDGKAEAETCTSSCEAGIAGSGNGQMYSPTSIAFSGGNAYVDDFSNGRVDEFSTAGAYLSKFGSGGSGSGQINGSYKIAADPTTGNLYVADSSNYRIQLFTPTGTFLAAFGSEGSGSGQFNLPTGVTISSSGNVYVADHRNYRIEQLTPAGAPSNITPANIAGELIVGQTLNAGAGIWSASPSPTYTYQWRRCNKSGSECTNISGATNSTYSLGHTDMGTTLRVVVTATNSSGSAESTSTATEVLVAAQPTTYAYDAAGNLESVTDPNGNKAKYTYDADNELTKVEEPNKTVTETEYDVAGQVKSQTDGNKHTTKYIRNLLEEVSEVINPKERKTTKEYDPAGNLVKLTDPEKRTTTYTYDPANRLKEISYSDGKTHAVSYEYNKDGDRTKMIDGTGTTKYEYDQLASIRR